MCRPEAVKTQPKLRFGECLWFCSDLAMWLRKRAFLVNFCCRNAILWSINQSFCGDPTIDMQRFYLERALQSQVAMRCYGFSWCVSLIVVVVDIGHDTS